MRLVKNVLFLLFFILVYAANAQDEFKTVNISDQEHVTTYNSSSDSDEEKPKQPRP